MPFIGRDWRSPGEAWVKTESLGWQRMKLIESQLHPPCHLSSACSWPPRSELGKHMANNCNEFDKPRNEFRESISSGSGSSGSSRGGSLSPSPGNSPEKNVHHLYPITISSPYGHHSCCPYHHDPSSLKNKAGNSNSQENAQLMSRSLSRECLKNKSPFENQTLRYNNSCSDIRATGISTCNHPISDQHTGKADDSEHKVSVPVLMKNGCRTDDKELKRCDGNSSNLLQTNKSSVSNNTCCCTPLSLTSNQAKDSYTRAAPHCRVSVRTREVAMYNTISEAFYRLDFCNAIHDIRRFNYICKLLHLLITENLTSLSGCATKVLFTMLEQVAWEVSSNRRNIHVLKNLLEELRQMIKKYYCWGRPIGSSLLWQQHFDTIERITQMVDGIELSPPKNDQSQATFNNLPVEMIREILLRLNDYRDLVNSAQASPVMRTMIDSQFIWKKLCQYHFNEQQLKLAVESQKASSSKGNSSSIRGIKYARTSSADGRTSFRNPIAHKTRLNNKGQGQQQTERMGGRRSSRHGINDETKSSFVTRTIKIFDRGGTSTALCFARINNDPKSESSKREYVPRNNSTSSLNSNNMQNEQPNGQQARSLSLNPSAHEIDWENVFHQLRKKFDLKEEYADCLLLCRHCRCLFWRSFGHPCIGNDEVGCNNKQSTDNNQLGGANFKVSNTMKEEVGNAGIQGGQNSQQGHQDLNQGSRQTVAALSRSFDSRAQRVANRENLPPNLSSQVGRVALRQTNQRLPDVNQQAQLRERGNLRVVNRRREENGNNNTAALRHKELVPKHVAISPQAFLKFFSL